ncbi:MAG: TIGR01244 family sulfur transferase [Croceibacterium sp.]
MSDFRRVTEDFWASPQLAVGDVADARARGFACLINNRPDGESADQPDGHAIEQAARAAGLAYTAIPVTSAGFDEGQVEAMVAALTQSTGPVLAFCRSGTRSTLLWSLAQASLGRDPDAVANDAAGAGYDVSPVRPLMDLLARNRRG